jgi:hypothetical protein
MRSGDVVELFDPPEDGGRCMALQTLPSGRRRSCPAKNDAGDASLVIRNLRRAYRAGPGFWCGSRYRKPCVPGGNGSAAEGRNVRCWSAPRMCVRAMRLPERSTKSSPQIAFGSRFDTHLRNRRVRAPLWPGPSSPMWAPPGPRRASVTSARVFSHSETSTGRPPSVLSNSPSRITDASAPRFLSTRKWNTLAPLADWPTSIRSCARPVRALVLAVCTMKKEHYM